MLLLIDIEGRAYVLGSGVLLALEQRPAWAVSARQGEAEHTLFYGPQENCEDAYAAILDAWDAEDRSLDLRTFLP
jgi:hypothetical protein